MSNNRYKNPEARENVKRPKRKLDTKLPIIPDTSQALVDYFESRRKKLNIVATTETPSGQVIDWVPIESQVPHDKIADPPSTLLPVDSVDKERADKRVDLELEDPNAERGPEGTVPILRKRLDFLPSKSLQDYLSKYLYTVREFAVVRNGLTIPLPEPSGGHRYASTVQRITAFGAEGVLSAYDPYTETVGDFSLIQVALLNHDLPKLQTIEAGWQECHDIYGDWLPHLFLFYTTNGHTKSGDKIGGYNQDVDGWVQYDASIHPGAVYQPTSERGGQQYALRIKFQLYRDNWWFSCNDRWLGYYPARLFMGNQSVFSTLGDHADQVHFYGEIFDSDRVMGKTKTDMGSGYWPEYRWPYSAYMHNLKVQTDRESRLEDYDGQPFVSDPDMYDLELHMKSGDNWGSYFWLGGPGVG